MSEIVEKVVEQPAATRPSAQEPGLAGGHVTTEPQPQRPTNSLTALRTGKGLGRDTVKRSEGKTGKPTPRTEGTRPSVSATATPAVENTPAPVEQPAAIATATPEVQPTIAAEPAGPQVLRPASDNDLIDIPGLEKPMTVSALKMGFSKMRDQDKREGSINFRENQLTERIRQQEERERAQATRPTQQFTEPKPAIIADQPPPRPAEAIEGDDLWAKWQAELIAHYVDKGVEKRLAPIAESINQTRAEKEAAEKAQTEAATRYSRNDQTLTNSIRNNLPFDPVGLSEESYSQVWEKIRASAMDLNPDYDFTDKRKMASIDLDPAITKAAIKLAFPKGSFPPGYEQPKVEVAKLDDKPIVPASPKKQLPSTITDSMPSKSITSAHGPGLKPGWHQKLREPGGLAPVTIRRSQGAG